MKACPESYPTFDNINNSGCRAWPYRFAPTAHATPATSKYKREMSSPNDPPLRVCFRNAHDPGHAADYEPDIMSTDRGFSFDDHVSAQQQPRSEEYVPP